jgi:bacterioferritin (cytochrome b1)
MNIDKIIANLQEDLANERKHMMFYLQAGAMVKGLHRQEYSELFLEESQDEHKHVTEFSKLIVQLGGVPSQNINPYIMDETDPWALVAYAIKMEEEVASNYSHRIAAIENAIDPTLHTLYAYLKVFYEDQLKDSMETAMEMKLYLK